ncbi:hypothetical protein [Flavobacterium hydatis]|uniref:Uncharacterized protein n=1 Tax=Flavobacterium hydatis TaxID=991 RepID=A0A086A082_FLAHY|nr:hypothetical protein [Flavobacterium hydatis]KFF10096.1 hypothetical protein IW20_21740 [Flavobacterium hydatis]OXA90353.1 hypothetical protein B0A62_20035 [Flavobacterium hydatis]
MNSITKKHSFFFITIFIFNLSYSILYLFKFYSKDFYEKEGADIMNLLFFQVSSIILLIFFAILNPLNLFIQTKKGIENRIKQKKEYFDIKGYNIISLSNKLTPFLITFLFTLFNTFIIILLILTISLIGIPVLEVLKFPFRFARNLNESELYYGVYSFLFLNIGYILFNPKKSAELYLLKFKVYINSGIVAFCICAFFILFNMFFYFSAQDVSNDVFTDKAKIAYAMFFNIAFVANNYLAEKGYLKIDD